MIRNGYYCRYKGKIFICGVSNELPVIIRSNDIEDVTDRNFTSNESYDNNNTNPYEDWNTKFTKSVPEKDVEWFCRIRTYGYYKGYKVWVSGETDTEYSICSGPVPADQKVFTKENGFQEMDRYLFIGEVPKNEITGIFEIKTPINEEYKAPDNWDF